MPLYARYNDGGERVGRVGGGSGGGGWHYCLERQKRGNSRKKIEVGVGLEKQEEKSGRGRTYGDSILRNTLLSVKEGTLLLATIYPGGKGPGGLSRSLRYVQTLSNPTEIWRPR